MSRLLIVESPAKAKTISKYLNDEYIVKASVGHIRDLPKSNKKAVDIENGFKPYYEISKGKEAVVSELKSLAKKADEVVLATDPDREGEAIAWHIAESLGLKSSNINRIVFHEITKDAVQEAVKHPRKIDVHLRKAQEARRVLDRLVGYDLSGIIWKKVRYGLSAGRVQSPALRILVEREREIKAFIPEKFWVISADLKNKGSVAFNAVCSEEPRKESEVTSILDQGKKGKWLVKDMTESKAKRSPKAPFITSTLQQTASTRLGFSPARTMSVAQKLYEAGLITYMRTDSTNLSSQALSQINAVVDEQFGKNLFLARTYAKKSKNAQEAHEAIRPSNIAKSSAGNTDDQKRLYKLIWQRTVASQMIDAEIMRSKLLANMEGDKIPDFTVNGTRVLSQGWLLADPQARGEEVELPKVSKGEALDLIEMKSEEKETQPPSRYSEAGLVKELEKRGIGRPSTYASTIKTLEDRGYVEKFPPPTGKALKPTDTGEVVSGFLEGNFAKYISDDFTASMEDDLDDIANGEKEYEKVLSDFYIPFKKDVDSKEDSAKATDLGDADPKFKCPKCGGKMIIKLGRGGKFLSCATYPECDGALTIEGHEIKPDEPIGIHQESGKEIYVLNGRFGPYVQLGKPEPKVKGAKKKKKKADDNSTGEKETTPEKPRRASIPKGMDPESITVEEATKFLSLPKVLGVHPETGEKITASISRFGPYIVHQSDFRSIKALDDVYTIDLARALEMLSQPKVKGRRGRKKKED